MSAEALNSFLALLIGFSTAGALVSGFQAFGKGQAGFGLLQDRMTVRALAAVPFLVFAAPFLIMRNTLRAGREGGNTMQFVMMATVLSGFWSIMSGTFVLMALRTLGVLV